MQAIKESRIMDKKELAVINRARCHQQVLFLSDILDAGGKCVDKRYLNFQQEDEIWSTAIFPLEKPPHQHLAIWRAAVYALTQRGRMQDRNGRFVSKSHKVWDWQYHKESNHLLHIKGQVMDIYTPSLVPRHANRPNCWTRSERISATYAQ
jgi:hypothetical protein